MIAPVSVARSTMNRGLNLSCAYHSASASTRRPSASVLMISIVWPDIDLRMSPGRMAPPPGMFSTRPITPTASTLALRLASACIRPTTQAAPAMSPFMSSMPAAGLIEMPPESKQTPLPTKATGLAFLRLGAAPAHDDEPAVALRALADAEQRAHAEFGHRLFVENFDVDAERLQGRRAFGEGLGIEHVRRLVDEVAGEFDAFGDRHARGRRGAGRREVARSDRDRGRRIVVLVAVLLHRLVFVEAIGAQPQAQRELGRRAAVPVARRRLQGDFDLLRRAELAEDEAAERRKVDRLAVLAGGDADDEKARRVERPRRENIHRGEVFAVKPGGLGGRFDPRRGLAQKRADPRRRLEVRADEDHVGSALGRGKRPKRDLDEFAHTSPRSRREEPRPASGRRAEGLIKGFRPPVNKAPRESAACARPSLTGSRLARRARAG